MYMYYYTCMYIAMMHILIEVVYKFLQQKLLEP